MSTKTCKKTKVLLLAVIGSAVGGLMVAANALYYSYELPWPGIVLGAVVGGIVGCWAGRCFFSTKEKSPPVRDILAELREEIQDRENKEAR